MAFSNTTNLRLPIITTGTELATWGNITNNALTEYIDISIAGGLAISIAGIGTVVTLTKTDGAAAGTNIGATTAQYAILNISGVKTGACTLNLPTTSKQYTINNAGTGGFLLTVRGVTPTTGITMVDGESAVVAWNGTDFVKVSSNLALAAYPVGSIYISTVATNPNTLFGFGTWVAFGAGRVLLGNGSGYSAGATGGSADAILVSHNHTATFTGTALATHTHQIGSRDSTAGDGVGSAQEFVNDFGTGGGAAATTSSVSGGTPAGSVSVFNTGDSGIGANLQPYIVVYMWNRTA